jgi:hypothetical protein
VRTAKIVVAACVAVMMRRLCGDVHAANGIFQLVPPVRTLKSVGDAMVTCNLLPLAPQIKRAFVGAGQGRKSGTVRSMNQ